MLLHSSHRYRQNSQNSETRVLLGDYLINNQYSKLCIIINLYYHNII